MHPNHYHEDIIQLHYPDESNTLLFNDNYKPDFE